MSTIILRGKDEFSQMIKYVYCCVDQMKSGDGWGSVLDDGDGDTMNAYDGRAYNGHGYGDPYHTFSQST